MAVSGVHRAVVEAALALLRLALNNLDRRDGEDGDEEKMEELHAEFLEKKRTTWAGRLPL